MAHIQLNSELPGMQALLRYRPEIAPPLLALMEILMRTPGRLGKGEREMLATAVSMENNCEACSNIHGAVAARLMQKTPDWIMDACRMEVSIARPLKEAMVLSQAVVKRDAGAIQQSISRLQLEGLDDQEIHDLVLIASLFTLYNKYIDGLAVRFQDSKESLTQRAAWIAEFGYQQK